MSSVPKNLLKEDDYRTIMTKKLGNCKYEISSADLSTFPEKKGLLGEHYQLTIKVKNDENQIQEVTHKFFVKTLPSLEIQKEFAIQCGAFFKEHQFFARIIPQLEKLGINVLKEVTPKCFLTRLEDVAVFEDVDVLGYKTLPIRPSFNLDNVLLVYQKMAKLHASVFAFEEVSSKNNKPYRMLEEYEKEFQESFYSLSEPSVNLRKSNQKTIVTEIDLFPNETSKLGAECLKKLAVDYIGRYNHWVQPSKKFRNTICHGDLWAANIMFKGQDCKIIDFQSYRYLPPAHDVMSFLYFSTDRKFRSQYKQEVLNSYYEELKKTLAGLNVDINLVLPKNDFTESLKEYEIFAASQSCTHFTSIMLTSDQLKELFSDPEYNRKTFFEDRSDMILKTCAKDCEYKEKLKESILDLWENFEKH